MTRLLRVITVHITSMVGGVIHQCPKVEGDEFNSSHYIHVQFKSVSDYAENLLKMFVVFLFWVIETIKSALSEKMQSSIESGFDQSSNTCPVHLV